MKNLLTATAVLGAACLSATVALADEPAPSVIVRISAADLQQPGVKQLYERIEAAAREVCAPNDDKELERHLIYKRCVDRAVARAVAQIHSRSLTEVHLAAHGAPLPSQL